MSYLDITSSKFEYISCMIHPRNYGEPEVAKIVIDRVPPMNTIKHRPVLIMTRSIENGN